MNKREAKAAMEALLFIMGDAVDAAALAAACETDEETAEKLLLELRGEAPMKDDMQQRRHRRRERTRKSEH